MALSHENRAPSEVSEKSLTYGEVVHSSFVQILEFVRKSAGLPTGATFVDLGCGTGKAVVIAALSTMSFSKVWGIELLEPLATCAARIIEQLKQDLVPTEIPRIVPMPKASKTPKVKDVAAPNTKDILKLMLDLLLSSPQQMLPCDVVVNSLCKQFGHKAYRTFLKRHGTFKKFILQHGDILKIDDNILRALSVVTKDEFCDDEAGVEPVAGDEVESNMMCSGRFSAVEDLTLYRNAFTPLPHDISIQHGDIFDIDWFTEANVVYCASLLFSEDMMDTLLNRCLLMNPGSIFISLKPLPRCDGGVSASGKRIVLMSESFYRMSWQMAKVYIYQVVSNAC